MVASRDLRYLKETGCYSLEGKFIMIIDFQHHFTPH